MRISYKIIKFIRTKLIAHLPKPHLSDSQYLYFASAFKTFSEGIMLGTTAAFFLPETLQLDKPIQINRFVVIFLTGLIILVVGGIVEKRGKHD